MSRLTAWLALACTLIVGVIVRTIIATSESDPWTSANTGERLLAIAVVIAAVVLTVVILVQIAEAALAALP